MPRVFVIVFIGTLLSQISLGSAAFQSDIEIRNGFIVITAVFNERPGQYIFDSGAPGLVLNSGNHETADVANELNLMGIHGDIKTTVVPKWQLSWNGFEVSGIDALAIDLSYLERSVGCEIDGLIGLDLFKGYYVVIDYSAMSLQLWQNLPKSFSDAPSIRMPLTFREHVPLVNLQYEDRTYQFALDCGSRSHLVEQTVAERWSTTSRVVGTVDLIGGDQEVTRTTKIEVSGLNVRGIAFPTADFVITDLSAMRRISGIRIDGILGQPLFDGRTVMIDRDRKFVQLSPKHEAFDAALVSY